jgi:hypothetical protein
LRVTRCCTKKGEYEPQRKSNFALVLLDVSNTDQLTLAIKDVDLPPTAFVQKGIKMFNETMHYAGSVQPFTDLTVNFHDYIDKPILTAITAWAQSVWNPNTGAINWARNYKKSGVLYMLPPGLSGTVPGAVETTGATADRQWRLEGIWIKSFKPDQFDNENDGDNTLINVVFSVDRAYPLPMKDDSTAALTQPAI